jgi:hypothetical protein
MAPSPQRFSKKAHPVNSALGDLAGRLKETGRIEAKDVLDLRHVVYGEDAIDQDEIEALLSLELVVAQRCPEWGDFFADALTDFLVHQSDPEDYVDEGKAQWLMQRMNGPLSDSGLQALGRIAETALQVPPAFASFALAKTKAAVIAKGWVSAAHVALLRRLIFAGDLLVSREKADILFAINDACRSGANDESWADFFAKAIADCLTAASPFRAPNREDALRDEAWLAEREGVGDFFKHMAQAPDVLGAARDVLDPFADGRAEWSAAEASAETDEAAAAPITDDEAKWLISRLTHGPLSEPERRLIRMLKTQARQVSDLLKPLLDAASPSEASPAASAAPPSASVFGHRKAAPA